nr:MAG TPA: hypothetical protein [Caudoviricetes sp.]
MDVSHYHHIFNFFSHIILAAYSACHGVTAFLLPMAAFQLCCSNKSKNSV